jgi:serine/threonine protein kinase
VRALGAAAATFEGGATAPGVRGGLRAGTVLKQTYEVIRLIGRGGMGEVYEVKHVRLSGRYALKVLRADVSEDQDLLSRFRREAEITSALRDHNIVQVFDFDRTPDGCVYLAMEYLDGCDLAALLEREGPLPLPRAGHLVAQIVAALSAAHRRGIIHRDLKPGNVFVVRDQGQEQIKLMDFGLSKWSHGQLEISLRLSRDQALIGTPRYMAPEQALARNQDVSPATDQFALGALTYEMLAGVPAFAAQSLAELLHAIAYEPPTPLAKHRPDLAEHVVRAVERALAKSPNDRFPSVHEFYLAVTRPADAGRAAARPRRAALRLALALAGAAGAGGVVWRARGRHPSVQALSRQEGASEPRAEQPPAQAAIATHTVEPPRVPPPVAERPARRRPPAKVQATPPATARPAPDAGAPGKLDLIETL